jgi:hypothetical protein
MKNRDNNPLSLHSRIENGLSLPSGELSEKLSRDDIFEALSNERRRCALYYLQQQEGSVALSEVVDYVAAWQYDQPVSQLDSSDRMCVYSALHQAHLPKLDEAGFIHYDSQTNEITTHDETKYARLYLEYDPGNDISWSAFYLGLVGIGGLLGGLNVLSLSPFDSLAGGVLLWVVLFLFGVSALGHLVHDWRNRRAAAELFEIDP